MTTIALVVPSFARPEQLRRCLESARNQQRPFDEIVVAARDTDLATQQVARESGVTVATVSVSGVLAAMSAGAAVTTSSVVAFTDDDARLTPTWVARVLEILDDPANHNVGGVGGRDVLFDGEVPRPTTLSTNVGTVSWWGRHTGNHHRGAGPARDVAVLKGVNCAYRRPALALPTSLRGDGAQAHFELSVGRYARQQGWRLRYDPSLTVSHYPAERRGDDGRSSPTDQAIADSAFNAMRGLSPAQQSRRWLYVHFVGDTACPGLVRMALALLKRDTKIRPRRRPSWRGTTEAWRVRHTPEQFVRF